VEQIDIGAGRLVRFEVVGAKVGEGDPVDILRWTPILWGV